MAAAIAKFNAAGELIAFAQSRAEIEFFLTGIRAAHSLEFDPETNPTLVKELRGEWREWRYDGVTLRRNGQAVVVNPPGERKQLEDGLPGNGWDALSPQQRTKIIHLLALLAAEALPGGTLAVRAAR